MYILQNLNIVDSPNRASPYYVCTVNIVKKLINVCFALDV